MQPNNPQRPTPGSQRPQFFDVVRPGRTPASPNARPVLANNHPPVPDTSMKVGAPAVPPGLLKPVQPSPSSQAAPARPQPAPRPQSRPMPTPRPATPAMPAPQDVGRPAVDSQMEAGPIIQSQGNAQPLAHQQNYKRQGIWSEIFAIVAILLLVTVIVNILLDADIINLPLPHTNFFDY